MTEVLSIAPYLEPLRCVAALPCSVDEAFRAFTADIAQWWPLATHSVWQSRARTCRFEPGAGGRIVEVGTDGAETTWAEVAVWTPPHGLVLRWHPGQAASEAQEVDIRFRPDGSGTRVEIEHRDWRRTAEAAVRREQYANGWQGLLESRFSAWVRANEATWRARAGRER